FSLYEARGWHFTPTHFYEPIPDTRELSEEVWSSPTLLGGLDLNQHFQLDLLRTFSSRFRNEYDRFPVSNSDPTRFHFGQTLFGPVDAELLYCMIRYFRPRTMIEIGSGMSTLLAAEAIQKNETEGNPCHLMAVEPHPKEFLRRGIPGLAELLETKVQSLPLERFCALEANDIVFIDSSHVIKTGGDVVYEYLEILPRLKPGVLVHCHDIFLPAEYPKEWVLTDHRFWTEQYLLQAFLAFNRSYEVLMAGSFLHMHHSLKLKAAFASYDPATTWPGSFWMRRALTDRQTS
ncbi:MAG TPA: class I SAM-dependent methyltransferase, partial [Candidatus Saccharimonadales bacterium]|nr:class I SAM-dependent methyltransferase [Candidatus Saccharimonadales bacterium]